VREIIVGDEEPPPSEETPWARPPEGDEAEPDWAEQIRSSRRDRGAKLREVYSKVADEKTPLDDAADVSAEDDVSDEGDAE
jgi:hypothetical protein